MTPERLAEIREFADGHQDQLTIIERELLAEVDALAARVRGLEDFVRDVAEAPGRDVNLYESAIRRKARALLAGDGRATEPETGGGGG